MSETNKNLNAEMTEQQLEEVAGGFNAASYSECPHCGYYLEPGATQCPKCLGYVATTAAASARAKLVGDARAKLVGDARAL